MTSEYVGVSILDIKKINYVDYLIYRREAFIYKMSQTEKGQEYLYNAWRLEQTSPDREGLKDKFGKEG